MCAILIATATHMRIQLIKLLRLPRAVASYGGLINAYTDKMIFVSIEKNLFYTGDDINKKKIKYKHFKMHPRKNIQYLGRFFCKKTTQLYMEFKLFLPIVTTSKK